MGADRLSAQEKALLIKLVLKHKAVLGNKKIDMVTVTAKVNCWLEISKEFNSNSYVSKRTWKQLRKSWENIKFRKRKMHPDVDKQKVGAGRGAYDDMAPNCAVDSLLEVNIPAIVYDENNAGEAALIVESSDGTEELNMFREVSEDQAGPCSDKSVNSESEERSRVENIIVIDGSNLTSVTASTQRTNASHAAQTRHSTRELDTRSRRVHSKKCDDAELNNLRRQLLEIEKKIKETELAAAEAAAAAAITEANYRQQIMALELEERKAESRRRQEAHELQMAILKQSSE